MKNFVKVLQVIIAWALVLILLSLAPLCSGGGGMQKSPETQQLSNLKQLGLAMKIYATDHNGAFPKRAGDLVDQYLNAGSPVLHFKNPATDEYAEWDYFPGHMDTDDETQVLAASPVYVKNNSAKRVVVYCDCSAAVVREEDFVRQLSKELDHHALASPTAQ